MQIIYRSFDDKEFDSLERCLSNDAYNNRLRDIFIKLKENGMLEEYKIEFFHNKMIEHIGCPKYENWSYRMHGYRIMGGRMGNADTYVVFKMRKDNLLIFLQDTDSIKKRYYGRIVNVESKITAKRYNL